MRTVGLFAGHCDDFQLIRATLRMLVACLATDSKQVNSVLNFCYLHFCCCNMRLQTFKFFYLMQYLALGVSRMEELLQCIGPTLSFADVCYLLHALFSMLQGIQLTG